MPNLTKDEQIVYDRVATVLNFNRGQGRTSMCLSDLCDGYAELGKTMLELEYAKLGYPDLQSLIQKFNIHSNPNGMLNTYVYGTTENGAAGVIDLMQKTIENPRPPPYGFPRNASHQPPIYQSSRALPSIPELSSSVSSKGAPVPFSPMSFRPIVIHGSSSDVPPSQFPLPKSDSSPTLPGSSQSLSEVPPLQLPKSDSSASRQGSSDHIKPSTDASRRFKNLNVNALSITEAASRASQGVVTPVGLSVFTAQHTPEQNEIIVGPHNLGATSSFETEEFDPIKQDLPAFLVKTMIFDATCKQDLQWKIALERPRTEKDENFFEFCTKVQHMIDIFPRLAPDDLTSGKCYFIKYGGRYYRGVFISLSRDNRHAIFDFADFDGVRPIPFKDIRPFPKRNEICVPFMIFWVYTNECNFKENDRVYCKFSGTFENTSYRKFYQAKVQKIEN